MFNLISKIPTIIALISVSLLSGTAIASNDTEAKTLDPTYTKECGGCHVAYSARLLNANAWQAILKDLGHHFNVDATVEEADIMPIRTYLINNARRKSATNSSGSLATRITESRWFMNEHGEISKAVWEKVKSKSNCDKCHTKASQGRYSEHEIVIPRN